MVERKQYSSWYQVYDEIRKSVVIIRILRTDYVTEDGKLVHRQHTIGQGSGFIYSGEQEKFRIIITANHVVYPLRKGEQITVWAQTRDDK